MRERNYPTIKETVKRTLRTSPLYRKTQSSNGCQNFSSERQNTLDGRFSCIVRLARQQDANFNANLFV
ncbi:unnamed protein product [Pleuronectes platessa]|uniref:Uncharacterized protein n=1 Tax=Pleuronectes platessa TaxID=8262 RepID=A0A9N7UP89_PLEPL|nr:unnamed protein product [Pleuronectes platessa]